MGWQKLSELAEVYKWTWGIGIYNAKSLFNGYMPALNKRLFTSIVLSIPPPPSNWWVYMFFYDVLVSQGHHNKIPLTSTA